MIRSRLAPVLIVLSVWLSMPQAQAQDTDSLPSPLRPLVQLPPDHAGREVQPGVFQIPINITEHAGIDRSDEPIRGGIPFPRDAITEVQHIRMIDEAGEPVNADFRVLSRWWSFDPEESKTPSIKWLEIYLRANLKANETRRFQLQYGPNVSSDQSRQRIGLLRDQGDVIVNTGTLRATFQAKHGYRLASVHKLTSSGDETRVSGPAECFADVRHVQPTGPEWVTLNELTDQDAWRFSPDPTNKGDSSGWADVDFDDSAWTHLRADNSWENQGYPTLNGLGWFRASFHAPVDWEKRDVWFQMTHRWDLMEDRSHSIYLNGKLLGTLDAVRSREVSRIVLPVSEVRFGKRNVIAIKMNDGGGGHGGLICVPQIVAQRDVDLDGDTTDLSGRFTNTNDADARLRVMTQTDQCLVICVSGSLCNQSGHRVSTYDLFYTFHADSEIIDITHTFRITESPARFRYQSVGLSIPTLPGSVAVLPDGERDIDSDNSLTLYQFHDGPGRYPGYPSLADHPFRPKFRLHHSDGQILATGHRTLGSMGLRTDDCVVSLSVRDFEQSHPSAVSVSGNGTLTAYMWPGLTVEGGQEMDVRMWADRKDGGWNHVIADAEKGQALAKRILQLSAGDADNGTRIPKNNRIGTAWTRHYRLRFDYDQVTPKQLANRAKAWDKPILPFVSNQWNCKTHAVGYPLHPYDPVNYPEIESHIEARLTWFRRFHHEWYAINGMWYFGAMRYGKYPKGMALHPAYFKLNWSRRWYNQESSQSPSMVPLMQYVRTGHQPHFEYGRVMAQYATNVLVRTWHPAPLYAGYASKHRYAPFNGVSGSHTNLEGVGLYYQLTGDPVTRLFLDRLHEQYRHETMEGFVFGDNHLDREHDGPFFARVVLWDIDGADWTKQWINDALDYYEQQDQAGFTNEGGATYRTQNMTSTWYRTRLERLMSLGADPLPFHVNGDRQALFETYVSEVGRSIVDFPPLADKPRWDHDDIKQLDESFNFPKSNHMRLVYPGLSLAAYYQAGLPTIKHDPTKYPKLLAYQRALGTIESYRAKEGQTFITMSMRQAMNADPFDLTATPGFAGRWLGQYHTINDEADAFDTSLSPGEIGWDFGPPGHVASGWRRVYGRSRYPSFEGYEMASNFGGYPFGASAVMNGVPFDLVDPATNRGNGVLITQAGRTAVIPVNRSVSRLFFLGHVMTELLRDAGPAAEYRIRYASGREQIVPLIAGRDYDSWRSTTHLAVNTRPVPMARMWGSFYRHGMYFAGFLRLNVMALDVDQNDRIESIRVDAKQSGFALLAVSAEVDAATGHDEAMVVYDDAADNAPRIPSGRIVSADVDNGWYDVTIQLADIKPARPVYSYDDVRVFIEAEGDMVVPGTLARYGQSLTFPVRVTDGTLSIRPHANLVASDSDHIIRRVTIRSRERGPGFASERRSVKTLAVHGFRDDHHNFGDRRGEGMIDHPDRDAVTADWFNVAGNSFSADVPNGRYEVTLLLLSPLGHPGYSVTINGQQSPIVPLPNQRLRYPKKWVTRAFEVIRDKVTISNGRLIIDFPRGVKPYYWGQMIGLRGIKLRPIE